jgi:hypothetical protein
MNHRLLSPGGWVIIIGRVNVVPVNTCSSFTAAVLLGRAGARQVVFAGRASSPYAARTTGIPDESCAADGSPDGFPLDEELW